MSTSLSPSAFRALPLHDAEFGSFALETSAEGQTSVRLSILLHEDEVEAARLQGVPEQAVTVRFVNCWRVLANFLGYASKRELVDNWEASGQSQMIDEFVSRGFAKGVELLHFRLTFSAGSSLEIVAEMISLAASSGDVTQPS